MAKRLEAVLAALVLLFAAMLPLSIAAAQTALFTALALWFFLPPSSRVLPRKPLMAAGFYSLFTLLSAAFSADPWRSLTDTKELLLFSVLLVVPPAVKFVGSDFIRSGLLVGATLGSIWGLLDYRATPGGLLHRSTGPYGHYMTFGGVLMLVLVALTAEFAARQRRELFQVDILARLIPLPLLLAALAVSYSRNAWLGYTAALLLTIGIVRPKLLWLVPVVGIGLVALSPPEVRERVMSVTDYKNDVSSRERIYMAEAGLRMIAANPVFGVGPDMVPSSYRQFRASEAIDYKPSHLHSNIMQIAAERGLPALVAWFAILWFAARDMWPLLKEKTQRSSALGALAAIVALLIAGLFEYNFGDSEVKMLFLCLLAMPYARSEQDS